MKVYIAGPITGNKQYREQFEAIAFALESAGHIAMNPAILPEGFEHHEYMNICREMVKCCEAVVVLEGWTKSTGALMEINWAIEQRKPIYNEDQALAINIQGS